MRLVKQQLGWEPTTSLRDAMTTTMKVFIEKCGAAEPDPTHTRLRSQRARAALRAPRSSRCVACVRCRYADKLSAKRIAVDEAAPACKVAKK